MNTTVLVLVLSVAYLTYRIYKSIAATYRHVDEETMRDYWLNRLKREDPEEHQRVRDHLGVCNRCRAMFDFISQEGRPEQDGYITRRF